MTTTTVRFPALDATPDGSALLVDLLVELVGANGRPLVGATTPDGGAVTCSAAATLTYDAEDDPPSVGVDFDLTPQDQIASPDGRATWYRVTLDAYPGAGPSVWLVQVPTSAEVVTFGSLIAGSAVAPADLAAGRLLPLTTGADPGDGLVLDADRVPRWSAAGGGGVSSLTDLVDGPGALGTAGQVLTVASGAAAWTWGTPTAAATWGGITGTLSAQTDLASALSGKETSGAAAAAVSAHAAAADPHPGYRLESASIALADLAQGGAASGQVVKWSGTAWAPADDASGGGGVSLGETETTAYRGDRGKAAYDHSQSAHAPSDATAAGAAGDAFATSHPGGNQHIDWTADQGATNIHSGNIPDLSSTYAPAAKGVTGGDSHDHSGGDGAQIAYSSLSGTPTLGTAAAKDIPATGNASATQVVYGSDTRLSDARTPATHASSHAAGQADAITPSAIGAMPHGPQHFWIGAGAMAPRTTAGAAPGKREYATNDTIADYYAFDSASEEGVSFNCVMPDDWDRGTLKFKFVWDADTGASANDGVTWGVSVQAISNGDPMDSAFGASVDTDDLVIGVGYKHDVTSAAVTVSGTPALGDLILFEFTRVVGDAHDDMAEDALLLGVQVQYTVLSTAASAW